MRALNTPYGTYFKVLNLVGFCHSDRTLCYSLRFHPCQQVYVQLLCLAPILPFISLALLLLTMLAAMDGAATTTLARLRGGPRVID